MCGSAAEQRKTKLRCSLCEVALCKHTDSAGISCWQAWHDADGNELQEVSKRRSDCLKEEREAKRYAKRQRIAYRASLEAEAEAEQGAFWSAAAAGASTGEAGAAAAEDSTGEAGALDGEAEV